MDSIIITIIYYQHNGMASIKIILQILQANKNINQAQKKRRSQSHFRGAAYTKSAVTPELYRGGEAKL
jgi:hypothetical protein